MTPKYLLSICIPTYNRAHYLDLCLTSLSHQWLQTEGTVELIISDNCSTDNTSTVVQSYIDKNLPIKYFRNSKNLGPDNNIVQCFTYASGKYLLILGDDDLIIEGGLKIILKALALEDWDLFYIEHFDYDVVTDLDIEVPRENKLLVYHNNLDFGIKINIFMTFISGVIINKNKIVHNIYQIIEQNIGSNLVQLSWCFSSLINSSLNGYLATKIVAVKSNNTSGYRLFQVFAANFSKILNNFQDSGLNIRIVKHINYVLISSFLPIFCLDFKLKSFSFDSENIRNILINVYKRSVLFWIYLFPIVILPYLAARIWIRIFKPIFMIKSKLIMWREQKNIAKKVIELKILSISD